MKAASVLPVRRPERQLAFNSKVQRGPTIGPHTPLIGRITDSALAGYVQRLWRICTTTYDGSLSETFKLDDSEAQTSASAMSKPIALAGDGDSFLDAVVVENDDHVEVKIPPHHQSDGSQRSGYGGSNSTGLNNTHMLDFSGLDDDPHYQGSFTSWIRHRGWPQVVHFFEPRFPEHEEEYQTQEWHSHKILAFSASLFLILNWVFYLILNQDSTKHTLYNQVVYWGGLTLVTLPTPFMVAFDLPRRSPIFFQTWFCIAVWYCAFTEVIGMRDFLAMSYYSTGLPALMMFIVSKRLYNAIAQLSFFIVVCVLILPVQGIYARNVVSFVLFSVFIQGLHYSIQDGRRTMFLLALQLKQAFKAKHKARLAESKASFAKRRFAYLHLPRSQVLAFQLLQSGNGFNKEYAKSTEIYALEQGLKMMKTVLNDVLDFEKMDSGHFETVARPFPLHHSIRAILDQVEVQTGARQLVLERVLDARIDSVPRSLDPNRADDPEGVWVLGSELRLHQVLTNLAANAVKYTPEGSIRISTQFLGLSTRDELPGTPPDIEQESGQDPRNSMEKPDNTRVGNGIPVLSRMGSSGVQTQCLNFRLEVQDSGPGIKPSDLVEDRLFQPFVQTTVGRSSGSGTGLGLAIVKQIVRLSGGRLGVTSRRGEGSKFWIELSYPIASHAEIQTARNANTLTTMPRPYGDRQINSGFLPRPPVSSNSVGATPAFAATASSPDVSISPSDSEARPWQTASGLTPPLTPLSLVIPSSDPLNVLVVDDDPVTRILSSKLLTKLGCVVHTARDGQECVDMVLGKDPYTYDMICLDNFMPVMTGEEAVKELRANDRDDFVVGCTGNALTEDQESYREAGADEVVVKPVMIQCVFLVSANRGRLILPVATSKQ
ncbi:hypothetical protein B0H11DRAFT_2433686 [Mycena galericulata]|nr:hypothetical protein B0H11DRAFT_2433686 [Mycena galericulata]